MVKKTPWNPQTTQKYHPYSIAIRLCTSMHEYMSGYYSYYSYYVHLAWCYKNCGVNEINGVITANYLLLGNIRLNYTVTIKGPDDGISNG